MAWRFRQSSWSRTVYIGGKRGHVTLTIHPKGWDKWNFYWAIVVSSDNRLLYQKMGDSNTELGCRRAAMTAFKKWRKGATP